MLYIILRILAGIDLLIWGILSLIHSIKTIDEFKDYGPVVNMGKFAISFILLLAALMQLSATIELI